MSEKEKAEIMEQVQAMPTEQQAVALGFMQGMLAANAVKREKEEADDAERDDELGKGDADAEGRS